MWENKAKEILVYYIRKAWEAAGLKWDNDNTAKVETVIDLILQEVEYDS